MLVLSHPGLAIQTCLTKTCHAGTCRIHSAQAAWLHTYCCHAATAPAARSVAGRADRAQQCHVVQVQVDGTHLLIKRTGGAVQAHAGMHNQRGRCFTGACRHALCLQGPQAGACQPGQTRCTPHTKLAAPGVHRLPAQNEIATYCAKWCTVQPAYTDLQPAH